MKRCPQCEFVYEDEQTMCDMDGSKLAFDSRPLPKLQALTKAPALQPAKNFWRPRLIPAAASLVLATVLGLVYYVSMHRNSRPPVIPAAQSRAAQPIVEEAPKDNAAAQPHEATAAAPVETSEKASNETKAKAAPTPKSEAAADTLKKKRPTNLDTPQPQPVKPASIEVKPKKESKVGAILKKTGRLLKKPFKF